MPSGQLAVGGHCMGMIVAVHMHDDWYRGRYLQVKIKLHDAGDEFKRVMNVASSPNRTEHFNGFL